MKKSIFLVILVTLPLALFAEHCIGGSLLYKQDPQYLQDIQDESFISDLAFGVEGRFTFFIYEISGMLH